MSPYAGSEDLLTLLRSLQKKEDQWIKPKEKPPTGFLPFVGRLAELSFFWEPINRVAVTLQHEIFGHGYRVRTLRPTKWMGFKIEPPHPFGSSGGATYFSESDKVTFSQRLLITIAGSEAEYILAERQKLKWIAENKIDARTANLYMDAKLGTLSYVLATNPNEENEDDIYGNDILSYINLLSEVYPKHPMRFDTIKKAMLLNLADFSLLNAVASECYYIATGKSIRNFMIPITENLSYLPSLSAQLAPYGIEYYLDNYMRYKERPIYSYLKGGRFAGVTYMGAGIMYDEMLSFENISYGVRFHAFYQPRYMTAQRIHHKLDQIPQTAKTRVNLESRKTGFAFSIVSKYRINDTYTFFFSDIGAKTSGYVPGYIAKGGIIARIGISGQF